MNIHLKPQISVFGISSPQPAGCGSDVEIFRSICDDWCWSETMPDNHPANEEENETELPSTSWPHNLSGCRRHYRSRGENLQNTFQTTELPGVAGGCQVFTNPRWTKYQHWQGYNSGVTGCRIMGSEGLVRTSGNYNALIGFSIELGAEHQPSKIVS